MTIAEAAALYWEQVGRPQKRPDQVLWSLDWLTSYFGDDAAISDIDGAAISRMVAKRRGERVDNVAVRRGLKRDRKTGVARERKPIRDLSPARVNRSVTEPLRKLLYFARDTLGQPIQPIKWKKYLLKEPEERIRTMKTEQEDLIVAALPEKYRALVFVARRIGLRAFELLKAKWSDVDWATLTIEIEGKGGSRATVPLPTDVRDALWALPRRGERLFTHEDGGAVTYSAAASAWKRACAKAGVAELHFHDLRHTAGTDLLRQTGNLKLVQKLLRHRDIRSTLRYAHADDADLREALERGKPDEKSPKFEAIPAQPIEKTGP